MYWNSKGSRIIKKRDKKSEVFELIADYKKLNLATGWYPKITFDQGINKTVQWFAENGSATTGSEIQQIFN